MTILKHKVTYQGYRAKAVQYSRSVGLRPDTGWVTLDMKDVKAVLVKPHEPAPWRSVNGFEFDSGLDPFTWLRMKTRATVTTPQPIVPQGKGLNQFGNLKMESFIHDPTGIAPDTPLKAIEYTDVYVDDSGIEDLTAGLARAKKHDVGSIQVPLTDVRKFYPDYGPLFCRINVRRDDGEWEDHTLVIDAENLTITPMTAPDVVRYLFSQLPGSPLVLTHPNKANTIDDPKLKLDPPVNLVAAGEPAVEHLERVLKELGMEAHFLPSGNYVVSKIGSPPPEYGKIPHNPGEAETGTFQHGETQSTNLFNVPAAVLVRGQTRIRRTTEKCRPVLRYDDGEWGPLEDVAESHGYPIEKVNLQAAASGENQFSDVPPDPVGVDNVRLFYQRREMYRNLAYRAYAPVSSITLDAEGRRIVTNRRTLMPMQKFAAYKSELQSSGVLKLIKGEQEKGDKEDIVLLDPVVHAKWWSEHFFRDFKTLDAYFQGMMESKRERITDIEETITEKKNQAQKEVEFLKKASIKVDVSYTPSKAKARYQVLQGQTGEFVQVNADIARLAGFINEFGQQDHVIIKDRMSERVELAVNRVGKIAEEIAEYERQITIDRLGVEREEAFYQSFREAHEKDGVYTILSNGPWQVVPDPMYDIVDTERGIIVFSQPMAVMKVSFSLDKETHVRLGGVDRDGDVEVTFGHEYKSGGLMDWTSVLLSLVSRKNAAVIAQVQAAVTSALSGPFAGPAGVAVQVQAQEALSNLPTVVGINRSSPIKPALEISSKMRLYEADDGTPMNVTAVVTQAIEKGAPRLQLPKSVSGRTDTWSGFRRAVLDKGVTQVEHEWMGGESVAHTKVVINNYAPRGTLSGPLLLRRLGAFRAGQREVLEADTGSE